MTITSRFLAYLERRSKLSIRLAVAICVLGLGIMDYKTGPELSISLLYLFPVTLASWALEKSEGISVAIVCAILWDVLRWPEELHAATPPVYMVWNAFARLGIFLIISMLLTEVHTLLKNESRLSHTDYLTGVSNRRALFESAAMEIERLARTGRHFTLIYLDLDDFKIVNDTAGHATGDSLLAQIATVLKLQLRGIDILARMGGDEFAILLPETDAQAASKVTSRLQSSLLAEMQSHHWPVTFSAGVLTCTSAPPNADEIFRLADQLMYEAKKDGKNTIRYKVYEN